MQVVRTVVADHRTQAAGNEHADPVALIGAKHVIQRIASIGLPAPGQLPTCKQRDNQKRDKPNDDQEPRQFYIAAGEIGEVCCPRSDDDNRSPVIHLMDGPVEALADDNDSESERQKWQSGDVPQSQITCKEVAHICAKNAGEAKRRPVPRAKRWQVLLLHADRPLSNTMFNCKMVCARFTVREGWDWGGYGDFLRAHRSRRLEKVIHEI